MRRIIASTCAISLLAMAGSAAAHTAWLVREGSSNNWLLRFGGHEGKLEAVVPAKLKTVKAYGANGVGMAVRRSADGNTIRISTAQEPSVIALHYDNGIHSRTAEPGPSVEKPMDQVPGAVSAVYAVKYGKTIVQWNPIVTGSTQQRFEVIPLGTTQPRAGQPMRVRVLQDGRPAAGVNIGRGEDTTDATTDANGVASFVPAAGFNKLWAGKRIEQRGNPRYTELSYEYLLGFEAR